tara:strand:- start:55 stop:489 length:435 start_codon:yes stop_codon:yes gene_type:complete
MWAKYNKKDFPNIIIKFGEKIENEEEFNSFLKEWVLLYDDKKEFNFIFDTRDVGTPRLSYVYKMRTFMKKIKQFPKQYLQWSIIIVSNKYIRYLLNMVFMVQAPIATVYIYDISTKQTNNNEDIDYKYLIENKDDKELFTIIKP